MSKTFLGIDIGGSGIKSAVVDVTDGALVSDRLRIRTPRPATPEAFTEAVRSVVESHDYRGPVGVGFPAVVRHGVAETASNIHESCIGADVAGMFSEATGLEFRVINDADAAAIGEATFGAAKEVSGLVLVITFGTGIGSGVLVDGDLVPNVELGQIELDGHVPAERHFSANVRKEEGLSWEDWGDRANRYLTHIDRVLSPELIVFGGGFTKQWEKFARRFDPGLRLVPAAMGNNAGLIGAATLASR